MLNLSVWKAMTAGLLAGCLVSATAQQAEPIAPVAAMNGRGAASGYLAPGTIDMLQVMPAAPVKGDARDEADRRIFRETRALKDSPRWQMASDDAELGAARMLHHFSCSLEIELTPQQAPRLVRMLQKGTRDAAQSMAKGKDFYKRPRPFLVDEGPICRPREEVGNSFDYPSGHATAGWSWALMLAQIAPEQAAAILSRGRAIAESRVVCGVHNASAVEAAIFQTGAVLSLAMATPEYQTDLAEARAEIATLKAGPHASPEPARCGAEAALINPQNGYGLPAVR